ncbi:hypothetical protein BaRGS_00017166 [Batillaria attramentaria]|uniref:Uncharacterized protein n=1 Tax=Batillaria attramentaria TaxID=370345 RepID=A0ABD0KWQ7_9CAEN
MKNGQVLVVLFGGSATSEQGKTCGTQILNQSDEWKSFQYTHCKSEVSVAISEVYLFPSTQKRGQEPCFVLLSSGGRKHRLSQRINVNCRGQYGGRHSQRWKNSEDCQGREGRVSVRMPETELKCTDQLHMQRTSKVK